MSRTSTTRIFGRKLLAMLAALCLLVTAFPVVSFASLNTHTYPEYGLKYQEEQTPYLDVLDENNSYLDEGSDYTVLFGLSADACNQTREQFAQTVAALPEGPVTIYYTVIGIGSYDGQTQSDSFTTFVAKHNVRNLGATNQVVLVGDGTFNEPLLIDIFTAGPPTGDIVYGSTSGSYTMTYDQAKTYLAGLNKGTYTLYYKFTGTGEFAGTTFEGDITIQISDIKVVDRTVHNQNAVPYAGTFPGVDLYDLGHSCAPTGTTLYGLGPDECTMSYSDMTAYLADANPGDQFYISYVFTGSGTYSDVHLQGDLSVAVSDGVTSDPEMWDHTSLLQTVRIGDGSFDPVAISVWMETEPSHWTEVELTSGRGVTLYGSTADNCNMSYEQAVQLLASQPEGTRYKLYYTFTGENEYAPYTASGAIYACISKFSFNNETNYYQTVLEGVGDFREPSLWERYLYEYATGTFAYGTSRNACTMTYEQAKTYLAGLSNNTSQELWFTFTGTDKFEGATYSDRLWISISDVLYEDRTESHQNVKPGIGTFQEPIIYDQGHKQLAVGTFTYGDEGWTYEQMVAYLATLEAGENYQFSYHFNGTGIYDGHDWGGWMYIYLTDSVTTDRLEDWTELKQYVKTGEGNFPGAVFGGQPDPYYYSWREVEASDGTLLYGTSDGSYTMTYEQTATYLAGLPAGTTLNIYYSFTGTGDFDGQSGSGKLTVKVCDYNLQIGYRNYTIAVGTGAFDEPIPDDAFGSGVTVTGSFAYGTERGTYDMTYAQAEAYLAAQGCGGHTLFCQFTGTGDVAGETAEGELYFEIVDCLIVDQTDTSQTVKPGDGTFTGAAVYDEIAQSAPTFAVAYGTDWGAGTMTYEQAVAYLAAQPEGAIVELYYEISGTGSYTGKIDVNDWIKVVVTNKVTTDRLSDDTEPFQTVRTGSTDFYGANVWKTDTWTQVSNTDAYGTTLYGTAPDNLTMTYSEAVAYVAALPDRSEVTLYYGYTGTGDLEGESATGQIDVTVASIILTVPDWNDLNQHVKTGVGEFRDPTVTDYDDTNIVLTGSYLYGLSHNSCTMTYAEMVAHLATLSNYTNVSVWFTFTADSTGYVGRKLTEKIDVEVNDYYLKSDVVYDQRVLYGDGTFNGVKMTDLFTNQPPTGEIRYGTSSGSYTMTYEQTKAYLATLPAGTSLDLYWQFEGSGIYTTTWTSSFTVTITEARSMADVSVSYSNTDRYPNEYIYTGSAIVPQIYLNYNGDYMTEGVDYTVTFSDNVNVGTATAVFQGMGVYTGSLTSNFVIYERSPITGAAVNGANLTVAAGDTPFFSGESTEYYKYELVGEGYESADGTVGVFGGRYSGVDETYCSAHYTSRLTAFESNTNYYYVAVFRPYNQSENCFSATGDTTVNINGTDYTYNDGSAIFSMDGDDLTVKIPLTLIAANDPSRHTVVFTDAQNNVLRTIHVADGTLFGDLLKPDFPNSYGYNSDGTYYYYGWQQNGTVIGDDTAITADLTVTYAREYLVPISAVSGGLDVAPITEERVIRNVPTGLTVAEIRAMLQNDPSSLTFTQYDENEGSWKTLSDSDHVGTGTYVEVRSMYDDSYLSEYALVVSGDVTGDGLVNADDYNELKTLILENTTCYFYTRSAYVPYEYGVDFNGDGYLDVLDLREMKRLLA